MGTTGRDPWSERRALLARHFLLRNADAGLIDKILRFASVRKLSAGDAIFTKGDSADGLYGVLAGRVRIYTVAADGREIVLNMVGSGEIFGEIALLDGKPRTAYAAALDDCELLFIQRSQFISFLEREPAIMASMIAVLCARLRWTSQTVEDVSFLDLPSRLAKQLLMLAHNYGSKAERGTRLRIRIPQKLLASMTGSTREAVNKALMTIRSQNIVGMDDGYLVLRDLDSLRAIAETVGD
jgi:CRP-like cAMP-binding protein